MDERPTTEPTLLCDFYHASKYLNCTSPSHEFQTVHTVLKVKKWFNYIACHIWPLPYGRIMTGRNGENQNHDWEEWAEGRGLHQGNMTWGASRQANCEEQHEAVGPIERQAGSGQQRCVYYRPWASSGAGLSQAS